MSDCFTVAAICLLADVNLLPAASCRGEWLRAMPIKTELVQVLAQHTSDVSSPFVCMAAC